MPKNTVCDLPVFEVHLAEVSIQKIQVIKEVCVLTGLGLKEAKELVDGAPIAVCQRNTKLEADRVKEVLEAVGATIQISYTGGPEMPRIVYRRVKYVPGLFASHERRERELMACIQKQGDNGWDLKASVPWMNGFLLIFGRTEL
jgi:hypothetical protein